LWSTALAVVRTDGKDSLTVLLHLVLILGFAKVHIGGAFGHDYKITLTDTRFEPTEESGAYTSDKDLDGEYHPSKARSNPGFLQIIPI
jgi:hypothetical protein